jgi:carbonic anhydrase
LSTETVENTGHYIEVVYDSGSSVIVGFDPLHTYNLLQFHFHAPAEHTVNGVQYDAEMHLVHQNAAGDLAVIAVLLKSSPSGLAKFNEIMSTAPEMAGEEAIGPHPVDVTQLLPSWPNRAFYTYTGSLTTPDCAEGVRFFILKTPVLIPPSAVARLHELISHFPNYGGYRNNNRPMLPLGSRTVFQTHY